ncbi:LCP family glycopolymer transferase [Streptomyces zingiberis]|nr:LCP family protein [Streptomyces zingiberis]
MAGLGSTIERVDPFTGLSGRPDRSRQDGSGEALTFLVVGTDGRDRITEEQRRRFRLGGEPCHCTDTILLVHLSADRRRADVVSIPRDTYVGLPLDGEAPDGRARGEARGGTGGGADRGQEAGTERGPAGTTAPGPGSGADGPGPDSGEPTAGSDSGVGSGPGLDAGPGPGRTGTRAIKINSAYAEGGPRLTVRTVERLTGVRVDHYLEVDFAGFIRTVDHLGGVEVCTPVPLRDERSGLDLPAGTSRLGGGEALAYVRARHVDAEGDLGRMRRQQRFLAALVDRAARSGVLLNPVKLTGAAEALLGSVRADPGLGTAELIGLGRAMRGLTASASEFVTVPVADPDHRVPGIGSTVLWDAAAAEQIFAAMREDRPLPGAARRHHTGPAGRGPGPAAAPFREPDGTPPPAAGGDGSPESPGGVTEPTELPGPGGPPEPPGPSPDRPAPPERRDGEPQPDAHGDTPDGTADGTAGGTRDATPAHGAACP